jgi:hypothetical protein
MPAPKSTAFFPLKRCLEKSPRFAFCTYVKALARLYCFEVSGTLRVRVAKLYRGDPKIAFSLCLPP